jgi:hypothetical protein
MEVKNDPLCMPATQAMMFLDPSIPVKYTRAEDEVRHHVCCVVPEAVFSNTQQRRSRRRARRGEVASSVPVVFCRWWSTIDEAAAGR